MPHHPSLTGGPPAPRSPDSIGPGQLPPEPQVSLLRLVNVVLARRWLLLGISLLGAAAAIAYGLLKPERYLATAAFMPQAARINSNLSGMAAQLGIAIPTGDPTQSPQFYADLVHSRTVLDQVVAEPFTFTVEGAPRTAPLAELLDVEEEDPGIRHSKLLERTRRRLATNVATQTGVITVSMSAPHPEVAQEFLDRLLGTVNSFNQRTRQSEAAAERRFTEERLEAVEAALRRAEERLEAFQMRNRDIRNAYNLQMEQSRLQTEVDMHRQLRTTLVQAYERASIEEVRDTPVVTIVERPALPARPQPRGLLRLALLGMAAGAAVALALVFTRAYLDRAREDDADEFVRFASLRRQLGTELVRPWRALRSPDAPAER